MTFEDPETRGVGIVSALEAQFGPVRVQQIETALQEVQPGTTLAQYIGNLPEPAALQSGMIPTDQESLTLIGKFWMVILGLVQWDSPLIRE